jgi:radical SAM protein with 4Fe4S-binding SPASM domain
MEIKADGSVYCCCEGWLPTSLGNILTDNLDEIWNGQSARSIRGSITDQSFRYCRSCPFLPLGGGPVVNDKPRSESDGLIKTLKLDYDQSCNLTCPSCRVLHSRDFVDVAKVKSIHQAMLDSGVLRRTSKLYVTGSGDPFASDLYWNFLRSLPTIEHHNDMTIFLHTNGLLFDRRHWEELGSTRDLITEVGISVDAASEPTYRTNRGASWEKLWSNIDFINDLKANGRNLMLGMFYTIQANNFMETIPFVRMAFNYGAAWISITALRNWGTYTPDDYQSRAVHLPSHPMYSAFRAMISDPYLTSNRRVILDSFNPEYTRQQHIINPRATLPSEVIQHIQTEGRYVDS